jgi:hypothetical protein
MPAYDESLSRLLSRLFLDPEWYDLKGVDLNGVDLNGVTKRIVALYDKVCQVKIDVADFHGCLHELGILTTAKSKSTVQDLLCSDHMSGYRQSRRCFVAGIAVAVAFSRSQATGTVLQAVVSDNVRLFHATSVRGDIKEAFYRVGDQKPSSGTFFAVNPNVCLWRDYWRGNKPNLNIKHKKHRATTRNGVCLSYYTLRPLTVMDASVGDGTYPSKSDFLQQMLGISTASRVSHRDLNTILTIACMLLGLDGVIGHMSIPPPELDVKMPLPAADKWSVPLSGHPRNPNHQECPYELILTNPNNIVFETMVDSYPEVDLNIDDGAEKFVEKMAKVFLRDPVLQEERMGSSWSGEYTSCGTACAPSLAGTKRHSTD